MKRFRLLAFLLAVGTMPCAVAQDLDELYRRMQAGDEEARREYWSRKKGAMREIFEQAYQGTLDEAPAPAAGRDQPAPGSGTPADQPTGRPVTELASALQLSVVALFNAYEQESIGGFLELVHASFSARDRSGTDYRQSDLPRVLSDDFAILGRIGFVVQVEQPQIQADGKRAQVEVTWSRRALVETGGQEWILLDQRSILQFEADAGGRFLLTAIFGDPIFAIARPTGEIAVTEGTIDGAAVTRPVTLTRESGIVVVVVAQQPAAVQPAAPAAAAVFNAPITGTETFAQSHVDFDAQVFPRSCVPVPAGADIDFRCYSGASIDIENGAQILRIDALFSGIESVQEAPAPPYTSLSHPLTLSLSDVGQLFAVQTSTGKFALFAITNFDNDGPPTYTIAYKYQADGSRRFKP